MMAVATLGDAGCSDGYGHRVLRRARLLLASLFCVCPLLALEAKLRGLIGCGVGQPGRPSGVGD
jgi:hypothetical protein